MSKTKTFYYMVISGESLYPDFAWITPDECVEAVKHSAKTKNKIELYLQELDDGNAKREPIVGLVFEDGVYKGFGLGGEIESDMPEDMFAQIKGMPLDDTLKHLPTMFWLCSQPPLPLSPGRGLPPTINGMPDQTRICRRLP